ncbi:MAG TPA: flagellar export protein FliJ [Limnobacter sp.]|nr:flagellar export protein FliJ [Limnobacter sp.]
MSNVLHILIDQAKEKADACLKAIASTQQKIGQAQEKRQMLEDYANECQGSMHSRASSGITGLQLRNQLAFAGKITQAIEQQDAELSFLQSTLTHQQTQWQAALAEQRKYEALFEREKAKQEKAQNKREQKMNDEFAARIHRVQTAGETT